MEYNTMHDLTGFAICELAVITFPDYVHNNNSTSSISISSAISLFSNFIDETIENLCSKSDATSNLTDMAPTHLWTAVATENYQRQFKSIFSKMKWEYVENLKSVCASNEYMDTELFIDRVINYMNNTANDFMNKVSCKLN